MHFLKKSINFFLNSRLEKNLFLMTFAKGAHLNNRGASIR